MATRQDIKEAKQARQLLLGEAREKGRGRNDRINKPSGKYKERGN
jgi:hypothetical protein